MLRTKLRNVLLLGLAAVLAHICSAGMAKAQWPGQVPEIPQPIDLPPVYTDLDRQFEIAVSDSTSVDRLANFTLESAKIAQSEKVSQAVEQLYIAAAPSKSEQVANLRGDAATELAWIQYLGFTINFQGLMALLGAPDGPATEEAWRQAREHMTRYYGDLEQIEALTGNQAAALRAYQDRVNSIRFEGRGHYSVHSSDTTARGNSVYTGGTHEEYEYHLVYGQVKAGFDSKGNPKYTHGYDVVRTKKQVPNRK